jgi:hypothetical protein
MGKYDKIEDNILKLYLSEALVLVHSSCHLNVCLKILNNSLQYEGLVRKLMHVQLHIFKSPFL